jgi:DNA replicative helicase MCM subunit Mcm2 (Cdc46/Mcm family)
MKYIKIKFTRFLTQFNANKDFAIYSAKIKDMAINNKQSFEVSFIHLKVALPTIAIWVGLHPSLILPKLNDIAYAITCRNYPTYRTLIS